MLDALEVAVLGSSGGGAADLGGGAAGNALFDALRAEFSRGTGLNLASAAVVRADVGLDMADDGTTASLLTYDGRGSPMLSSAVQGSLREVNVAAREADERLADAIRSGEITALVTASCDPTGVNAASIAAAAEAGIPVVGTGGSSIAVIIKTGALVLGASGGSVSASASARVSAVTRTG